MAKALEDMSLEELWQLFPIFLEEHNKDWAAWYVEESRRIVNFLPENQLYKMHHIGSTSKGQMADGMGSELRLYVVIKPN